MAGRQAALHGLQRPAVPQATRWFGRSAGTAEDPTKKLKAAKAAGMKLIVVDPRECELASSGGHPPADLSWRGCRACSGVDPDCARETVEEGLRRVPCRRPEAASGGVSHPSRRRPWPIEPGSAPKTLSRPRGCLPRSTAAAASAPGCCPHGKVPEPRRAPLSGAWRHLRPFPPEGEALSNPGVLFAKQPPRGRSDQPRPPPEAPRSRVRGAVRLMGEFATPTLAEEILTPGKNRIRALLISGANPASAIPDSGQVVEAFRALDLPTVIEPFWTETARLADHTTA